MVLQIYVALVLMITRLSLCVRPLVQGVFVWHSEVFWYMDVVFFFFFPELFRPRWQGTQMKFSKRQRWTMFFFCKCFCCCCLGCTESILQYCGDKFSVEPVDVTYDDNSSETQTTPLLSTRTEEASVAEICSIIGVEVREKGALNIMYRTGL